MGLGRRSQARADARQRAQANEGHTRQGYKRLHLSFHEPGGVSSPLYEHRRAWSGPPQSVHEDDDSRNEGVVCIWGASDAGTILLHTQDRGLGIPTGTTRL